MEFRVIRETRTSNPCCGNLVCFFSVSPGLSITSLASPFPLSSPTTWSLSTPLPSLRHPLHVFYLSLFPSFIFATMLMCFILLSCGTTAFSALHKVKHGWQQSQSYDFHFTARLRNHKYQFQIPKGPWPSFDQLPPSGSALTSQEAGSPMEHGRSHLNHEMMGKVPENERVWAIKTLRAHYSIYSVKAINISRELFYVSELAIIKIYY